MTNLIGRRWSDLTPEERASLPVGTELDDGSRTKSTNGWTCSCCDDLSSDGGLAPDRVITHIPGVAPEPIPARSSPRRPLDHADLTHDWTPYIIPGRPGFVHFDCPDCLTRSGGAPVLLCPDRVKAAIEGARIEGRREMRAEMLAWADDLLAVMKTVADHNAKAARTAGRIEMREEAARMCDDDDYIESSVANRIRSLPDTRGDK